MLNAILTMWFI